MSDWVLLSERKPRVGQWCLVVLEGEVVQFQAWQYGLDSWSVGEEYDAPHDAFSHWMPLPKPPKRLVSAPEIPIERAVAFATRIIEGGGWHDRYELAELIEERDSAVAAAAVAKGKCES